MEFDLIVSQGRVGDRKPGAIEGAALTAQALERRFEMKGATIGSSLPAAEDDWRISLSQAKETLSGLHSAIMASLRNGNVPVMVANTCSASLASLPAAAMGYPNAVVLWIDAHGDFNTPETSGTGYLGGMVLSAACGLWDSGHGAGLRSDQIILIGARDIDQAEGSLLHDAGVRIIPPIEASPDAILRAIGSAPVWIHLDWDALEPGFVPADYRVPGGLLPEQVRAIFHALPPEQIAGVELAEFVASEDGAINERAVSIIIDVVEPLFGGQA